jgi:cold shock protein
MEGGGMNGTISKLITDKGFGFIKGEDGQEYFMHRSAIQGDGFEQVRKGQVVTFDAGRGDKGLRADNVRLR